MKMKEYILINRVPEYYDKSYAQKINDTWNIVTQKWKEDEIFVSSFVFPSEGYEISESERIINKKNVLTNNLKVVSLIILKADNYESAIELAKSCPHIDQSGTVEIREIILKPS